MQVKCLKCGFISKTSDIFRDIVLQAVGQEDLVSASINKIKGKGDGKNNRPFCGRATKYPSGSVLTVRGRNRIIHFTRVFVTHRDIHIELDRYTW